MAILNRAEIGMLRQALRNAWPMREERQRQAVEDLRETIAFATPGSRLFVKATEALAMFDTIEAGLIKP